VPLDKSEGSVAHALAVTQHNFVAENKLANALIKQGRYDDAITHFRTASDLA